MMVIGYDPITNSIIEAYIGTENVFNWIEDADFVKVDYIKAGCNGCHVHKGFFNSYNSLAP